MGSTVEAMELEQAFRIEYRREALTWAMYAALFGALLWLAFFLIVSLGESTTTLAQLARALLCLGLGGIAGMLWKGRFINVHNYVPVASFVVTVVLVCTIALPILHKVSGESFVVAASPSIICGLFILYSFLRLPLWISASIGISTAALAAAAVPVVSGGSEGLRTLAYLLAANLLGGQVSRLIESRERELFRQRRLEEAARLYARERQVIAEEADRQKTRLIAAVSHDLRQPMTAALSYLEVVRNRLARNELELARGPTEKAVASLTMLGATLDHLLTAARYDSGTEALDIIYVELAPLLRDLYEGYITEAEKRGVRFRVRLPKQSLILTTDSRSVHRVLSNLIANAIKFTDPAGDGGGGVLVAARLRGDLCRIDVIDTGIGISPEHLDEIWKPYTQLNNVQRDRERGLGLGLFLVQRIVEQLPEHTISMASRPGHGSRFTLTVPAARLQSRPTGGGLDVEPIEMPDVSDLRGAYVLLLEDDRDTRLSIAELLCEWGVLVTAASTVSELATIDVEGERSIDAIVCDFWLAGGVTGIDAIAGLRARLGYAPHGVLITGVPDIAPLRARAGPETTVLHKPFTPEALAQPLLRAVRAMRMLEQG